VYRKGSYPDAYITLRSTFLRGRPPKSVNFYWRRFAISDIPLNDQKEFEIWLNKRWAEKDQLLEQFAETGRFPPCEWLPISNGDVQEGGDTAIADTSYIETEVRLAHWTDVGRIFMVLFFLAVLIQRVPRLWDPSPCVPL
jgi:Acyltransferase C-terminus